MIDIRIVGAPADVEQTVALLQEHLRVARVSRPYPCRDSVDQVRVYLVAESPEVTR